MKSVQLLFACMLLCCQVWDTAAVQAGERGGSAPRVLLITVVQTADAQVARDLLSEETGDGDPLAGHGSHRVYTTGRYRYSTRSSQVRVLEGEAAVVQLGLVVPEVRLLWVEDRRRAAVPTAGITGRPDIQGFHVRAGLEGDRVRLEVTRHGSVAQVPYSHPGPQLMLSTTVTGRAGNWLDLGGTLVLDDPAAGAATHATRRQRPGETRVLVRVEPAG